MSNKPRTFSKWQSLNAYEQDLAEENLIMTVSDLDDRGQVWNTAFFRYLPNKKTLPKVNGAVRALDLGCNTGYNTKKLKDKYGYAEGIDSNTKLIHYSKYNVDTCKAMSALDLKYDDESFSFVMAKDLLEHCTSPSKAISEAYRVLADGGTMTAMIPLDGEAHGRDDVITHPSFASGNHSHPWKATEEGVLRRFFEAGFTDVQTGFLLHSQLFGTERDLGDRVMVISAVKDKNIVKVPYQYVSGNPYWAGFLTLDCTSRCWYCIQHVCKSEFKVARTNYESNRLSGEEWINFYNRLQKFKGHRLGIIGGEPTLHPDFFDIVNGIKDYYMTITSNLTTDNIKKFDTKIKDKTNLRINTSFHPSAISVADFSDRVHMLRGQGFHVDQIAMVDTPFDDYRKYALQFIERGISLYPQTFLGIIKGELFPNPDSTVVTNHGETGIDNIAQYREGFSCKEKNDVLCATNRFLVAPDGGIYRCHYHLYSKREAQGDVRTGTFPPSQDYVMCKDYGHCNPCDFPHASFRMVNPDISQLLLGFCGGDKKMAGGIEHTLKHYIKQDDKYQTFFTKVFSTLYASRNPWWELYNNKTLHAYINEFVCEGSIIDNDNAEFIGAFEYVLFKVVPAGVNLYRIFSDEALVKYLSIVSAIHSDVLSRTPEMQQHWGDNMLLSYSLICKILATYGSATAYSEFFSEDKPTEEVQENE
jgi:SAM-dependent methyltransferase